MPDPARVKFLNALRRAVADYLASEGCACCRNTDEHRTHLATLARLLRVPKHPDGSGYDFGRFATKEASHA